MIQCESLSKEYSKLAVVNSINLGFQYGHCYALLGKNGAGKSTLLKLLADALSSTAGRVLKENGVKTFYLGLSTMLYDSLSAHENLSYFRELSSTGDYNIMTLLTEVGLGRVAHKKVSHFSQGMKQRLVIARAMLLNETFLLLDEPFSALDIEAQHLLKLFLQNRKKGGYILVDHDIDRAFELCEDIIILKGSGQTPISIKSKNTNPGSLKNLML